MRFATWFRYVLTYGLGPSQYLPMTSMDKQYSGPALTCVRPPPDALLRLALKNNDLAICSPYCSTVSGLCQALASCEPSGLSAPLTLSLAPCRASGILQRCKNLTAFTVAQSKPFVKPFRLTATDFSVARSVLYHSLSLLSSPHVLLSS